MTNHKPMPPLTVELTKHFEANLTQAPSNDGCIFWSGALSRKGYGIFRFNGSQYRAHRVAYWLHYRNDPADLCVCHDCDNPSCCNWQHLWVGTNKDNSDDRDAKRRGRPILDDWSIRYILNHPERSNMELSRRFCVSDSTVIRVRNGFIKPSRPL